MYNTCRMICYILCSMTNTNFGVQSPSQVGLMVSMLLRRIPSLRLLTGMGSRLDGVVCRPTSVLRTI